MRQSYPKVRVKQLHADRIAELEAEVAGLRARILILETQRATPRLPDTFMPWPNTSPGLPADWTKPWSTCGVGGVSSDEKVVSLIAIN